jgi:hypothetical protein
MLKKLRKFKNRLTSHKAIPNRDTILKQGMKATEASAYFWGK